MAGDRALMYPALGAAATAHEAAEVRAMGATAGYNYMRGEFQNGDTVVVDVSAVTGKGVDELIEMLALVAELRDLKANPGKPARATVLDAQMSGTRGPVATVLVQEGTLRVGDAMVTGIHHGRVRAMMNERGATY